MKFTVEVDIPAGKYCDDCLYAHVQNWATRFPGRKATCLLLGSDLGYLRLSGETHARIMRDDKCPARGT